MKYRNIIRSLAVLYCLFSAIMSSRAQSFDALSVNDGLSQNTVMSIVQDAKGRMWFGTMDGLNLYDGYQFKVFRRDDADSLSLGDNLIRNLFFDKEGRLWTGTETGLSYMDAAHKGFHNLHLGYAIHDIAQISEDLLMFASGDGLKIFDAETMKIRPQDNEVLSSVFATELCAVDGDIYVGTMDGSIFIYSGMTGDIRKVPFKETSSRINEIVCQDNRYLWIATEGDGLFRADMRGWSVEHWLQNTPQRIASNYIRSLLLDSQGRLWVGSFRGLDIFDGDSIRHFENDPFEPGSLSQNSVRDIFEDSQGGIWLGTYFGGLNYWHPLNNRFKLMTRLPKDNSLNDNVIGCIVEGEDRTLWIGTNSGGVNHYIPSEGRFEHFKSKNQDSGLESNDIKSIWLDEKAGKVYIGAHAGGLSILDRRTGRMTVPEALNHTVRNVYAITPKSGSELWLGSLEGLYIFNKQTRTLRLVNTDVEGNEIGIRSIKVLTSDSEGNLWIAGDEGVEVYDMVPGGLKKNRISKTGVLNNITFVNAVFETADKAVWIGTRNGLYRCLPSTGALLHYTTAEGLPNNIVNGIEEDRSGRLWLGTDYGLCCFNPYAGTFRNFTIEDGLQGNQFNKNSHCFTADGQMYFGGINGLTAFYPDKMEDNPYIPAPVLTDFQLFGQHIHAGDQSGILATDISETECIHLKPDQNTFTLMYSVPNYLSARKDSFAYRLKGYDENWYEVDGKRVITYSNVPDGHYVFQLKAANNDGIWNEVPTELEIIIAPEWYRTTAAKVGFVVLILLIFILVLRFLVERTKMKNRLILDEQEKEHQEELHQMKTRFFINISHELRTPLTLILNPLQELIVRESDTWKRKHLKYIEKNAQRLLHLVNQLMDYRRAELGVFKLRVRGENAHKIIKENWSFYEKLAQSRKIKYTLTSELEGQNVYVDGQYLELILNNLLSNAFKYTENGHIGVHCYINGEDLTLEVSDTGVGIAPEEQEKIFERFYQCDDMHIGSGIGLSLVHRLVELHHGQIKIDSKPGEGSTFTVTIPQNLSVYAKEEISGNEGSDGYKSGLKDVFISDYEPQEESELISPDGKRARLLVAENNDEVRHYMRNVLSDLFDVKTVKNGKEAIEWLQTNETDLIITDLMMPVMGGDKLCAHVKQNISTAYIPVIIVSAKTDVKDQLEALRSGADAYLFKPFSMNVLIVRIQNMLRTSMRISDRASKSMDISPEKMSFNAMDEQLLNKAIEVVQQNLDNADFSTEEFAQAMNMSRSNLHLKLKALTGESALDFIRKVRFKEACKLLRDGRYSVSEVSDKVGFTTPSYFATSFKKHMGCLPTEYIKQHKIL